MSIDIESWPSSENDENISTLLILETCKNAFEIHFKFVLLFSCGCKFSVSLPYSAMGWSVVYDCGIS